MLRTLTFTYDGISCEDYDLMIYHIGDPGVVEESVWEADILEERLPTRIGPNHYGLNTNKPMTRQFTIGSEKYIDKDVVSEILDWLTSHDTYKWLEFDQDDLSDWRYKAIFTNIQTVSVNGLPFAFKCDVVFDSYYAYEKTTQYSYEIVNGQIKDAKGRLVDTIILKDTGYHSGYYYPKMTIKVADGCDKITVTNLTDNPNRKFIMNIPASYALTDGADKLIINVDNKNQIITSNSNLNMYKYFGDTVNDNVARLMGNHYFFRLLKGDNELKFEGSGIITFECEFIRKVGV